MAVSGKIVFKLGDYLKSRNYPKLRLSKDTGVDYRTILRYCNNKVPNIKVVILEQICRVLDCRVEDILEFEKD